MRLAALAQQAPCVLALRGSGEVEVSGVADDSRRVTPGDLYVAVRGTQADGVDYIAQALGRGAVAVAVRSSVASRLPESLPLLLVDDDRLASGQLAAAFAEFPQRVLRSVGITGTNGKTTTATLARALLQRDDRRVGFLGTIGYDLGGTQLVARETTPGGVRLIGYLQAMRAAGLDHLVMEVSSHALDQRRTASIDFEVGVLTNITRDHLDYHGTLAAYRAAKRRLFSGLPPHGTAVLNADEPAAREMARATEARRLWYGLGSGDVRAEGLVCDARGARMQLVMPDGRAELRLPLVGLYNVSNALAAAAAAWSLGVPTDVIAAGLEQGRGVPGRLERVEAGQDFGVLVDYAHTEDALETVLETLRPLVSGRLIVAFGCGGDRDRGKRPAMGAAARRWADAIVLTSDNPRSEDPQRIISEVATAFSEGDPLYTEVDRRRGIACALSLASSGADMVLIAGKGHEDYQELGSGRRLPFDDRLVARELIGERLAAVVPEELVESGEIDVVELDSGELASSGEGGQA